MSITAVILCGGQGSRLRHALGDLPKCLAPVAERTFIEYILDYLATQRVSVAYFCTRPDLEDRLGEVYGCEWKGMELGYWSNKESQETSGDLKAMWDTGILSHPEVSDPVLVINGDTYCKFDLPMMLAAHQERELMITHWGYFRPKNSGVLLVSKKFIEDLELPYSLKKNIEWAFNRGQWSSVGPTDPVYHDIGTPEGHAGAEEFLRQQGIIT